MSVYSKARYELRQSVAYSFDDCIVCKVDANATNTTCANTMLIEGDDYYNGHYLRFYLGTHKDTTRRVTDFATSGDTITFAPALATNTDTTDYFELSKKYTPEQYNDAINRAISMGKDEYLLDKKDETTVLVSGTYEYAVPSGFRYISQISLEETAASGTYNTNSIIDSRKYWVVPVNATNSVIKFDDSRFGIGAGEAGRDLRIIGQSLQSELSNDADTCLLPTEYVIQMVRALMLAQTPGREQEAQMAYKLAMTERQRMVTPPVGVSVFEI